MTPPRIPDIPGIAILTPQEMNDIHFSGHHTPTTPSSGSAADAEASTSRDTREDIAINV